MLALYVVHMHWWPMMVMMVVVRLVGGIRFDVRMYRLIIIGNRDTCDGHGGVRNRRPNASPYTIRPID